MKHFLPILVIISLSYGQHVEQQYETVKNELLHLKPIGISSAPVHNLVIRRDAGVFTLTSGVLYQLSAINGADHALLFVGEGTGSCTPPTATERKQLNRFYGKEHFEEPFRSIFFLFNDSTYHELTRGIPFVQENIPKKIEPLISTEVKFIQNTKRSGFEHDIFRQFLINERNEFFYAHVTTTDEHSYFFVIDPFEAEEVSLQHKSYGPSVATMDYYRESICTFHTAKDYAAKTNLFSESNSYVTIQSYSMKNTIRDNLDFSSQCTVSFSSSIPRRSWIPFRLYEDLIVDSVRLGTERLFSVRDDETDIVWLGRNASFPVDSVIEATFYYHGPIIDNSGGWYSLRTSLNWYPWPVNERQYTTFDLTFIIPEEYKLVSVGKKVFSETNNGLSTSRWQVAKPIRNASFMMGNLSEFTVVTDSLPPITLFQMNAHSRLDESAKNELMSDVQNSLKFFYHLYGRINLDQFYVTEIPQYHGEAFPGYINLSQATFRNSTLDGNDEIFRSHEVAHQWWGIGVDYKTYHDRWLSEAFAEYSGLSYMQIILKDNETFFKTLEIYKKSILSNRKYLLGNGQEAGPIWLGNRTHSNTTAGDYSLIIYRKGAWILHMLRNLGIDLKTMNEDIYMATMRDFFASYSNAQARTEDFQMIVERHFGISMDWFFQQWVYNTEIPTYSVLYKLVPLDNGKYKVKCTVKQSNVPDDFQMYIPFRIDFGENRLARLRFFIKGPVTEFDFPVLPLKPEKITFNDLESVLCEVDDEDWD